MSRALAASTVDGLRELETALSGVVRAVERIRPSDVPTIRDDLGGIAATARAMRAEIQAWRDSTECCIWLNDGGGHCSIHGVTFKDDGREDCRTPESEARTPDERAE